MAYIVPSNIVHHIVQNQNCKYGLGLGFRLMDQMDLSTNGSTFVFTKRDPTCFSLLVHRDWVGTPKTCCGLRFIFVIFFPIFRCHRFSTFQSHNFNALASQFIVLGMTCWGSATASKALPRGSQPQWLGPFPPFVL